MKNYIYIFFISMIPIIEIRGAIPSSQILKLPLFQSIIISVIGNIIPIPITYFFSKKILMWGTNKPLIGKLFFKILKKGHIVGEKILKKGKNKIFYGLMMFVAIPLPGTGAYTATLAASILDLDFKKSFIYTSLGIIFSSIIILLFTYIFKIILF